MSLRWEEHVDGAWAWSGSHIIGMVVPVQAGPYAGKVAWTIGAVTSSRHQPATSGYCRSVKGAKGVLLRAWLIWLRERGLAEVS